MVFANAMGGVPSECILFTSSGTESNNIALRSVMIRAIAIGRPILIISNVEHASVRKTAECLSTSGVIVKKVRVDSKGMVIPSDFERLLLQDRNRIGMISIILAQNEVGTIQNIRLLSSMAQRILGNNVVPFHTDATQAFGKIRGIEPRRMGVSLMTASAHKFHGLRGVGILFSEPGLIDSISTPITGGGQERGCRSGTENVAAIVAAAVAIIEALGDSWVSDILQIKSIRDEMLELFLRSVPGVIINGDPVNGLPNTLNITFPGVSSRELSALLDKNGISVAGGSACSKAKPSEVLHAMYGHDVDGALRLSISRVNTRDECLYAAREIVGAWKSLRT
jgi:cysteine desulfurase